MHYISMSARLLSKVILVVSSALAVCSALSHLLPPALLYTPFPSPFSSTLKLKVRPDLVAGLIELVEIERKPKTERGALVEFGVVREGSNAAVVDLGFGEAHRVKLVF